MRRARFRKLGKRILVTLLATSMLFSSISVNAMVSSGDAEAQTVEVQEVTGTEQNDAVLVDATEPANMAVLQVSSGDVKAEDVALLGEEAGASSFTVDIDGVTLDENVPKRIFYADYGDIWVHIWSTVSVTATPTAVVTNEDGSEITGTLIMEEETSWYYSFNMSSSDFTTKQIVVTYEGADYTYEIIPDSLYYHAAATSGSMANTYTDLNVGASFSLSSEYIEGTGVLGYIATDDASVVSYKPNEELEAAWAVAGYTDYDATYGSSGKYYVFTYNDEVYYPSFYCAAGGSTILRYYYYENGEAVSGCGGTINVGEYSLDYNGTRIYDRNTNPNAYVSFTDGDLVLDMYKGDERLTSEDATVTINGTSAVTSNAVSVEEDETGYCIRIEADKIQNWNGEVIGLSEAINDTLYFGLSIYDLTTKNTHYFYYQLIPEGILIADEKDYVVLVEDGGTFNLPLDDIYNIFIPEMSVASEGISDMTITSSDTDVLALHGTIEKVQLDEYTHTFYQCYMEPKSVGTSTVTIQYKMVGDIYTKTFNVVVGSEESPKLQYYDEEAGKYVTLEDGAEIEAAPGERLDFRVNMIPWMLSDVMLTSSDASLISTSGSLDAEYVYTDRNSAYISYSDYLRGQIDSTNTGTATLTFSAVFNGQTYTQDVVVNVQPQLGLQVKYVSLYGTSGEYGIYGSALDNVYLNRYGDVNMLVLGGVDGSGTFIELNAADYNFEVLKYDSSSDSYVASTDYEVRFHDEVSNSLFYVVIDGKALDNQAYKGKYVLRISPKETTAADAETVELKINFNMNSGVYLSYDEINGLSQLVNTVDVVAGKENVFYFKAPKSYENDITLRYFFPEDYDYSMTTEIVKEGDTYNIIKATVTYSGSTLYGSVYEEITTSNQNYIANVKFMLYAATDKDVPVANQRQISAFWNAADSSCDISGVRLHDYEVALKTLEDGSKVAVYLGYLGKASSLSMRPYLSVNMLEPVVGETETAITIERNIMVIGCEDGAFDTSKGYSQPKRIYVPQYFTYFGANGTGWTNSESGIRTYFYRSGFGDDNGKVLIGQSMLFTTDADGNVKYVDTGNADLNLVFNGTAVLDRGGAVKKVALDMTPNGSVSYYKLGNFWLRQDGPDGYEASIRVAVENEQYCLALGTDHIFADKIPELQSGTYYMTLIPVVEIEGQQIEFPEVFSEVDIAFEDTEPVAKLSATSVTLDAAYSKEQDADNYSTSSVRLVMNEGVSLAGLEVAAPNVNAEMCIDVAYDANGTIHFEMAHPAIAKAGTYKLTPVVKTASGGVFTLNTVSVAVSITNSSKATLSFKGKSITVNPYIGYAVTDNGYVTVKGFDEQDGVRYTYSYVSVPTSENAKNAGINVDGYKDQLAATRASNAADGQYTYNIVGKIKGSDGTITYTKPLAYTIQVAKKPLTIVPDKSSLTVYKDYCAQIVENGATYYYLEIPLSVKEKFNSYDFLKDKVAEETENSLSSKGVVTTITTVQKDTVEVCMLGIKIPVGLTSPGKLKITPKATAGVEFGAFTVSVAVNTKTPKVSFRNKTASLNRFTTDATVNEIAGTEGYEVTNMEFVSVKKGSADYTDYFNPVTYESSTAEYAGVRFKQEHVDSLADGTYTVTFRPTVSVEVNGKITEKELEACSFSVKIYHSEITMGVGEDMLSTQSVYLYPELGEAASQTYTVNTLLEWGEPVTITKLELVTSDKKVVAEAEVNGSQVAFKAVANEDGTYTNGKNTYQVRIYAKNINGTEDVLIGTMKKGFVVEVKTLTSSATLANTKLTFNPYMEESITTSVKSAELEALVATGRYFYTMDIQETDSKYRALSEEKLNDLINVAGAADGTVTVTTENYPSKNATYYYQASVRLLKDAVETDSLVKTYTVKFKVSVKNTKPAAMLQKKSVTLNSAYIDQAEQNSIFLKSGTDVWTLADHAEWNVVVKDKKNKDITAAGYFNVAFVKDDADNYTGGMRITLNNEKEGKLFNVSNGTYKIVLTPSAKNNAGGYSVELLPVTITVKVVSNRPTVKYPSTKLTVNTYANEEKSIKLKLSNEGAIDAEKSIITCTKLPKGVTSADAVKVFFDTDGNLTAFAERNAVKGTYTYSVTPVTSIDGNSIMLDAKKISVVVTDTKPAAVLSAKKVFLNTAFGSYYKARIEVTAKNAGTYDYSFNKSAIATTETNKTKKANASLLLENMSVVKEYGVTKIVVELPADGTTIPNGTYKFKLTPSVISGNVDEAYELKAVTFSVQVENKKPAFTAKVKGNLELAKANEGVACQVSMSKQIYDSLNNLKSLQLIDPATGERSEVFTTRTPIEDWKKGFFTIMPMNTEALEAGESYSLQVRLETWLGQVYTANVTVKVK